MTGVELRPFPYPYRAGLALCNDADALTVPGYARLQRFLCGRDETEWGQGLGLTVGGSFFMFRSPDSPNEFTVFDRLTDTITDDGGCFTDESHFTRALAERALATLESRGIRIETWVNHGSLTNIGCIGGRDVWQGDRVGAAGYHADLTVANGVRWIWTGLELTDEVALEGAGVPRAAGRVGALLRRRAQVQPRLCESYRLRDGQEVRRFWRFAGVNGRTPILDDLPEQLGPARLDQLVDAGGFAVVYQHLAVRRVRPGFGVGAYGPVDDGWFRPAEVEALRGLARRFDDGDLWVVPTTSLLRYRDAREHARWELRPGADGEQLVISGITRSDAAHLTVYCDRPERLRVAIERGGVIEAISETQSNRPDHTGRASVTVLPEAGAR